MGGQEAINVFISDPDYPIVDATNKFWDCREVKTPAERFDPAVYNTYIADGDPFKLPIDPLFAGEFSNPEAHYGYATDANGQSFVLVTRYYEGTAPFEHRFTSTTDSYFWNRAMIDSPWPAQLTTGKQYVVRSPNPLSGP